MPWLGRPSAEAVNAGAVGALGGSHRKRPVRAVFAENYDEGWSLNDFQRVCRNEIETRAEWQAMDARVVSAHILNALVGQSLRPRQDLSRLQIVRDIRVIWSVIDDPDAAQEWWTG